MVRKTGWNRNKRLGCNMLECRTDWMTIRMMLQAKSGRNGASVETKGDFRESINGISCIIIWVCQILSWLWTAICEVEKWGHFPQAIEQKKPRREWVDWVWVGELFSLDIGGTGSCLWSELGFSTKCSSSLYQSSFVQSWNTPSAHYWP